MLVVDKNGESMAVFQVTSFTNLSNIFWQTVEPVFFPEWKYTDYVKSNSRFFDNPHLVGREGDCLHSKIQIKLSLQDLISASIKLDPSCVYYSATLTDFKPVEGPAYFRRTSMCPGHYILDSASKRRCLFLDTTSYEAKDDYGRVTTCFSIDSKSSSASLSATHQCDFLENRVEQDGLRYTIIQNGYELINRSHPNYKLLAASAARHEIGEGLIMKFSNKASFKIKDKTYYIAISDKLLKKIWSEAVAYIKSGASSWMLDIPAVPFMPIEESFLDDLYETLDRPTMNSFATLLEVAGSLRNLKNLTNCFKKIKKLGGIRKTLLNEGSHLLKDEKLKTASNLYLTKKYVYDTTRMDLEDFFKKYSERMAGLPNMVRHLRYNRPLPNQAGISTHNFRIDLLPPEQSWADLYGFDLPAEAVWDMIPYSFVVDWFCNIGQSIESVEKLDVVSKLDIYCVIESIKQEWFDTLPISIDSIELNVSRRFTVYHRTVLQELPPIYPSSPYLSNPFSHILAGAALIFQKKK